MIIDGHAHACGSYLSAQSIEKYLGEHNLDMVVLTGGEPGSNKNYSYPMFSNLITGEKLGYLFNKIICRVTKLKKVAIHIDEQNEFVSSISKELPGKVINTYWANPLDDDCIVKMVSFYQKHSFYMVKLHQCWTKFDISSETCLEIFSWAADNKLPVFIHLLSQEQVLKFIDIANRYPNETFIVAHMMGAISMAGKLTNNYVFFDLSAPQLYSFNILNKSIRIYGAEKLLLGSDIPYGKNNIEKIIKRLKKVNLSEYEINRICCENIKQLLMMQR